MTNDDIVYFGNLVQCILQAMNQMARTLQGIESTLDHMADLAAANETSRVGGGSQQGGNQ